MNKLNPRGSEWQKWDLQVQTYIDPRWIWPADYPTDNNKMAERIDKFCTDLIAHCVRNEIAVVAITDHNSGDAIDGLLNKNRELEEPITLLPGVEVISSEGIHLIIIFDPQAMENRWETWAETVRQFLTAIDMPRPAFNGEGNNVPATSRKSAEEVILEARKFNGVSFFAHARSTNGGLFCRADSRTRQRLLEICNILDAAADTNDLDSRVNNLNTELTNHNRNVEEYALINTSDSRRIEDIGSHFTWIKADPTFEGLKQIIYEPKDRVSVEQENPYSERQKIYLGRIKFSGSKNFIIPDIEIPLNRELITIIGGRGSGKSALLESVAFLNEAHLREDQNKKKKIIEFYRQNLESKDPTPGFSLSAGLIDKDGNEEIYEKDLNIEEDFGLPFLYIGQEQLSALATNDHELTEKICDLLSIDATEFKQSELVDNARDVLTKIQNLSAEIKDLLSRYLDYKGGDFIKWIDKFVLQKEEQKKKLSSKVTRDLLEEISKALDRGMKLKDYKDELENFKVELKTILVNKRILEINKLDKKLYADKSREIPAVDFSSQENAINTRISEIGTEMSGLRSIIVEKKKALVLSGLKEDISVLMTAAETLQREINNATRDKENYKQKEESLGVLLISRNKIYNGIATQLEAVRKQIDDGFEEFKRSREDSKKEEVDLFNKVIEGVGVEGQIVFNQNVFCSYILENCVDRRTIKTEEDVKSLIAKKNEKGQAKDISLDALSKWITNELDSFLAAGILNTRGADNMLSYLFTRWDDFLSVRTIVKLKNVPIEKLSVGQRGTLLLKIYLATASVKQIFIVDQPEDNLDNQFIMNELVPLVRQIKKSRQIVLSTHNANLVVNADLEQIIVARLDSDEDYVSGGIENPLINKSIKEILEGGEQAFINRENKYGMGDI